MTVDNAAKRQRQHRWGVAKLYGAEVRKRRTDCAARSDESLYEFVGGTHEKRVRDLIIQLRAVHFVTFVFTPKDMRATSLQSTDATT